MCPTIIAYPEAASHPARAGNDDVVGTGLVSQIPVHLYLNIPLHGDCGDARLRVHASKDGSQQLRRPGVMLRVALQTGGVREGKGPRREALLSRQVVTKPVPASSSCFVRQHIQKAPQILE